MNTREQLEGLCRASGRALRVVYHRRDQGEGRGWRLHGPCGPIAWLGVGDSAVEELWQRVRCQTCAQVGTHSDGCARGPSPKFVRITSGDRAGHVLCIPCAGAELRGEEFDRVGLRPGMVIVCDCCEVL